MSKTQKLSKAAQTKLDAFAEAAQQWGWERDQGYKAEDIAAAERAYLETRGALYDLLLQQQQRLKVAQSALLKYQPPK